MHVNAFLAIHYLLLALSVKFGILPRIIGLVTFGCGSTDLANLIANAFRIQQQHIPVCVSYIFTFLFNDRNFHRMHQ